MKQDSLMQFRSLVYVLIRVLDHLNQVLDLFFDLIYALYFIKPCLNVLSHLNIKFIVLLLRSLASPVLNHPEDAVDSEYVHCEVD